MLKSLKQQMTTIKEDFNDTVLKLQEEKLNKCTVLSMKIEELRKIYHSNGEMLDVNEHIETFLQFVGKSFKV